MSAAVWSWEFLATTLIVVMIPGTGALYTVAAALAGGFRAGFFAALGCTVGILPHMAASILGMAAILNASPAVFHSLKAAGVVYLLWMAWGVWRGAGALALTPQAERPELWRRVVAGVLINLLNPKLSIFFLAFLPQFVPATRHGAAARMAELGAVFMALTLIVFTLYGAFAAALRTRVLSNAAAMAWLRRIVAASFAVLSLRLAIESP